MHPPRFRGCVKFVDTPHIFGDLLLVKVVMMSVMVLGKDITFTNKLNCLQTLQPGYHDETTGYTDGSRFHNKGAVCKTI